MFIVIGVTSIIASLILLYYYFVIKDNKEQYIDESDKYPMYHWKFFKRYWISILICIIFFLFTLGVAAILISI